jgi:hypothetical protein
MVGLKANLRNEDSEYRGAAGEERLFIKMLFQGSLFAPYFECFQADFKGA